MVKLQWLKMLKNDIIDIRMNIEELSYIINKEGNYKTFNYKDLKCEIIRNRMNVLCGYVYITKLLKEYEIGKYEDISIICHGGLTYSEYKDECLVIGFDCEHSSDIIPMSLFEAHNSSSGATYKDMKYVENELISIIEQLDNNNDNILTTIYNREKNISNLLDNENNN